MSLTSATKQHMMHWTSVAPRSNAIGRAGALAGLGGGLAMALVAALLTRSLGQDLWYQFEVIASVIYGPAAIAQTGFAIGPVLVGIAIHLAVAALLGALFGIVTRRVLKLPTDFGVPMVTGLVFGLVIWLMAYFVVVPALNPLLLAVYAPAFIIQHIIYGTITGLIYAALRPQPYASMT
jgi:uncharacterized YccA/Bax inhibitor family protein